MEQEHTLKQVHHRDGSTGLIVGCEIRQLIVSAKGLTFMTGTNPSCQIVFLTDDILEDGVDGLDIRGITK